MYVGSSNVLGRRLNQYFDPRKGYLNKKDSGLLLPLIKKDGLSAFTLKVFVMPADLSSAFYFLFLEQYFLLDPKFSLNSQLIVNFRVNQGTTLFIYNADFSVLYYTSNSINALKRQIGIHHSNIQSCIQTGELFLGAFRITSEPRIGATKSNMSLQEFNNLIDQKRKLALLKNRANPVYIYNKDSTTLYYSALSLNALEADLGLSHRTSRNCIKTGLLYANCFRITSELIPEASLASMPVSELKALLKVKRLEAYSEKLKGSDGLGSRAISVQSEISGEVEVFSSITAASAYLKTKGTAIFRVLSLNT